MKTSDLFRRYWREMLLSLTLALPWLSLVVLGSVWLWQSGFGWAWSLAAAMLGLLAWPLSRSVRQGAKTEARLALADQAEPSRGWNPGEQKAWTAVLEIADTAAPLSFTELDPLLAKARETVEIVAGRLHPEADTAWAQFSLSELLLLTERLCRDFRRRAVSHLPAVGSIRLSHLLWVHRQNKRYGTLARAGWRIGYAVWWIIRAGLNPLQAVGQESSSAFVGQATEVLSYRLRAYATRLLVLEVGRAAIDLYAGRLALSDEELRVAREHEIVGDPGAATPVRIVLFGQINAGKSSLLNALDQEIRGAVGPLPTTEGAAEYLLDPKGRPAASIVDTQGFDHSTGGGPDLVAQAERADLIMWVASAIQPAREPDRRQLGAIRTWANEQLMRRTPPILLALTHVDQLRPAAEWSPPYNIQAPARGKARAIRAAIDATSRALDLPVDSIVPVAMPPGREFYNVDALWARIGLEIDEAKLVQLDRLRLNHKELSLGALAGQLGHTGRTIIKGALGI